jgi:hypothetical protein
MFTGIPRKMKNFFRSVTRVNTEFLKKVCVLIKNIFKKCLQLQKRHISLPLFNGTTEVMSTER